MTLPLRFQCPIVLILLAVGCGDDPALGTGSAGGNPLMLTFQHDPETDRESLEWQTPTMRIGGMWVALPDDAGECGFESATFSNVDETFAFDELSQFVFNPPYPCGIQLEPPQGEPLLTSEAQVNDTKTVRVELWAPAGMRIRITDPDRLETSQDVFFILKPDRLLDGLDFQQALNTEDLVVYTDQPSETDAEQLETNFVAGAVIYIDPTPGDDVLAREERVADNIIGWAALGVTD